MTDNIDRYLGVVTSVEGSTYVICPRLEDADNFSIPLNVERGTESVTMHRRRLIYRFSYKLNMRNAQLTVGAEWREQSRNCILTSARR